MEEVVLTVAGSDELTYGRSTATFRNAYVRIEEHSHGLDAFIQRPTHTLQVLRDRHMSLGIVVLSVRLSWHVHNPLSVRHLLHALV